MTYVFLGKITEGRFSGGPKSFQEGPRVLKQTKSAVSKLQVAKKGKEHHV